MIILILSAIFNFHSFSQEILTFDEIRNANSSSPRAVKKHVVKKSKKSKNLEKELKETKEKLESYRYMAKMRVKTPLILSEIVIGEGESVGAKTVLGIMATNASTTITLNEIRGVDLPRDAKIRCQVISKYRRICGTCNRLIINGVGKDIKAELKNRDGTNCVIGSVSEDEEKYLTGMAVTELAKGALAISQSSIPTVGGNLIKSSAKTKLAQGGINLADTATDIFKEKYQTKEPIVTAPKGTEVIVQFNERVEL